MLSMFGHTWSSAYGTQPEGMISDTWAAALGGLSTDQLAAGLNACVAEGNEFPPNAPRFRCMCLGVPPFAQVKLEIHAPQAERSPFTRLVWSFVNGYAYRHAPMDKAERLLHEAYELAKESRMRGAPLPASSPLVEEEKPIRRGATESHVRKCFDEIDAMLQGVPSTPDPERREHKPTPLSEDARSLATQLDRFEAAHAPADAMEDWP